MKPPFLHWGRTAFVDPFPPGLGRAMIATPGGSILLAEMGPFCTPITKTVNQLHGVSDGEALTHLTPIARSILTITPPSM